jgi:hypothetical protein
MARYPISAKEVHEMAFRTIVVLCVALVLSAADVRGEPPETGKPSGHDRIDLSSVSLDGVCATREDLRNVLSRLSGDDSDDETIEVWFRPTPRRDEIATGGDATYLIDRRTGKLKERKLGE